ncbi:hypothetical protein [Enterococcus hailinensis]|uniref:hypothetical protein n=1 Tax=Enterococcus hailinensis TaxID=3238988 RepID=UPI0038B39727
MENLGQTYAKILNPHLISIQNNLAPAARISEQMNPMIKSVASLAKFASPLTNYDFMNSNVMRASEESKRSIAQAVENSILRYIQPLNFPNQNIANNIIANTPKPYFPDIVKVVRPPKFDMSKYDFRIKVLQQDVSKNLSYLLENPFQAIEVEEDYVFTDFDEPSPEPIVYAKENNQYTNDIDEIKSLLRQVYKRQEEQMNRSSEKNIQESKQSDNSNESSQFNTLAFISGVMTLLSLMTAPKEIYEFLVWVDQIVSFLINK